MILGAKMPPRLADGVRRIAMILPTDLIKKINAWRAAQPDVPNFSAAARRLMERGLDADGKAKRKGGKPGD